MFGALRKQIEVNYNFLRSFAPKTNFHSRFPSSAAMLAHPFQDDFTVDFLRFEAHWSRPAWVLRGDGIFKTLKSGPLFDAP